jgi:signal transduction histidine kinase
MEYDLKEILDLENFRNVLDNFYKITKIPYGLLDSKGNIILGIGWQDICLNFHRKNKFSELECKKSNFDAFEKCSRNNYYIHTCRNGIIDSFIPISIKGEKIAYLILGHFLFEEADVNSFINRAKKYNYNMESYINSLKKVPIINKEDFNKCMEYYISIANMISSYGEKFIDERNAEQLLIEKKINELSKEVEEKEKLIEEVIANDVFKTEFFSNLSHELRTPINVIYCVIQTYNSLIDEISGISSLQKQKFESYNNIMQQNCFRLIRIVNKFLDITKFDSGCTQPYLQECNIVELIESITLCVADYIKDINIEVIFDTNVEEKIIACDTENIEKVILNLLSNAVKFTNKDGQILVDIIDKGSSLIISVKDTGNGIPTDKQEKIFERFVQADKSFSRLKEGSGIGLALVKKIVEMHKWSISLNSQIGCGTEVHIKVPLSATNNLKQYNQISQTVEKNEYNAEYHAEKVNIEFSDIYL